MDERMRMNGGTQREGEPAVHKVPLITLKDAKEYEEIKARLIAKLKQLGSYEPEVDDLQVDAIARATIYIRNSEKLLDTEGANEETYSRVADAQAKLRKMIDTALDQLSLTRKARIASQPDKAGEEEFVRKIMEELKNRPK
jgi:hypothetical protein